MKDEISTSRWSNRTAISSSVCAVLNLADVAEQGYEPLSNFMNGNTVVFPVTDSPRPLPGFVEHLPVPLSYVLVRGHSERAGAFRHPFPRTVCSPALIDLVPP